MQLRLDEIQQQLEFFINATPSGTRRNTLTDINILLMQMLREGNIPTPPVLERRGIATSDEGPILKVPNAWAGEVGEDLPTPLQAIMRGLAAERYYPADFGENDGSHTELLFIHTADLDAAATLMNEFIHANGSGETR